MLVAVLVGAGLFGLSILVFGRGEELGPLPRQASPTKLPETGADGADVRALKFQVRLRGYDMREVDWALARLAEELDSLRARLDEPVPVRPEPVREAEAEGRPGE